MDDSLLQQFKEIITEHSGLQLRAQEEGSLRRTLGNRVKALRLTSDLEYLALLKGKGAQSSAEWRELSVLLTNQESYFFRDTGQFTLLRETILPQLIEHNRDRRALRLWSAGCSTGEEPYSLAILIDQLLPKRAEWKISITGTDLSEAALIKARRGIYGGWSFRTQEDKIVKRYFRKTAAGLELEKNIRDMVSFQHGNLTQDQFPASDSPLNSLDLIICRNVFIYFSRDAVDSIVGKFARTLRPGGYFLCGHAELHNLPPEPLQTLLFAETVIYQRAENKAAASVNGNGATAKTVVPAAGQSRPAVPVKEANRPGATAARTSASEKASPPAAVSGARANTTGHLPKPAKDNTAGMDAEALLKAAMALIQRGAYAAAVDTLQSLLNGPAHFDALLLAAQACANSGDYERAGAFCRRAIEADPFSSEAYHLLAQIAEERGELDEARTLLKKVIYLAPASVAAYLALDAIYEREGDAIRAAKMRDAALQALQGLDDNAMVPRYEGRTAGQLKADIRLKQKR